MMILPVLVFFAVILGLGGLFFWLAPTKAEQRLQSMTGPTGKSDWTEIVVKIVGPFAQLSSPTGDASPGQLSFVYWLWKDGAPYNFSGTSTNAAPNISAPTPVNSAPVSITFSGLDPGARYSLSVWSVSQAGLYSATPTVYNWRVLAAAPSVSVLQRPDVNSGSVVPEIVFIPVFTSEVDDSVFPNVTLEVKLVDDR